MKLSHYFFLRVIGFFCFPYLIQAATPLHKSKLWQASNRPPSLLYTAAKGTNALSADTVDQEAALLRKNMRINAMVQRSWISSMVIPGLGQIYNKHYWKVPCLYLGFALVGAKIYAEHQEMNKHKRILIMPDDGTMPTSEFTEKRIGECRRARDLFVIIATAWYLFNILDAYAGGHDKTVNFTDDIGTKPTTTSSIVKPFLR